MDPSLAQNLLTLLEERRQRALRRRDALRSDVADIVERSSDASRDDEHDPEGATIAFERAQVASLVSAAEQELVDVDRAVKRLRSGIHDRCESCGGEVPAERLRARPPTQTLSFKNKHMNRASTWSGIGIHATGKGAFHFHLHTARPFRQRRRRFS